MAENPHHSDESPAKRFDRERREDLDRFRDDNPAWGIKWNLINKDPQGHRNGHVMALEASILCYQMSLDALRELEDHIAELQAKTTKNIQRLIGRRIHRVGRRANPQLAEQITTRLTTESNTEQEAYWQANAPAILLGLRERCDRLYSQLEMTHETYEDLAAEGFAQLAEVVETYSERMELPDTARSHAIINAWNALREKLMAVLNGHNQLLPGISSEFAALRKSQMALT